MSGMICNLCVGKLTRIWAYPVVGIPSADMFNDVADKARAADQREIPILVYRDGANS